MFFVHSSLLRNLSASIIIYQLKDNNILIFKAKNNKQYVVVRLGGLWKLL